MNEDTKNLLKECNAGVKMGVDSINDVLDNVESRELEKILTENKEKHQEIGSEIHVILNDNNESVKEPNPMAKGMSWMKTNVMMAVNESDHTIADIMTDGCNMGIKSLNRCLNKYSDADSKSKGIAKELIDLEHQLTIDIRPYL